VRKSVQQSRRGVVLGVASAAFFSKWAFGAQVACSSSQLAVGRSAMERAKAGMNTSISRLNSPNTDTINKIQEWFGSVTPGMVSNVRGVLTRAVVFADGASFTCLNASQGVYAYVYSNSPFGITLGDLFFPAPDSGFDSKPGILVHEMTHFTLVGGTGDAGGRYGVAAARDRAKTDPALAIRTADNFEYFVESIAFK
jgi:peptidyl-Lys metalloendopeptidase